MSLQLPAPGLSSYNPFKRAEPSQYGPPTPAPGGIRGWFNDKLRSRNSRSAAGAYEQPLNSGYDGRRGFGPLDPDEAWDSRVGHEADNYGPGGYYEEQGTGREAYPMNLAATPGVAPSGFNDADEPRGRSRDREPEMGLGVSGQSSHGGGSNPFDDDAEPSNISMRRVSPRPIDTNKAQTSKSLGPASDSPTERRSIFREDV
jgi:hypothetical protein